MKRLLQNCQRVAVVIVLQVACCITITSAFALRHVKSQHFIVKDPIASRRHRRRETQPQYLNHHAAKTSLQMIPVDSVAAINQVYENLSSFSLASLSDNVAFLNISPATAEAWTAPLFAVSLFPYLAFLYWLNASDCPKGVIVGFATCLLFVFGTIPAAITAKLWYGVALADCDWLHGSAESLLTVTNLVTVLAFRQALQAKEEEEGLMASSKMPASTTSYAPMTWLVVGLSLVAALTAILPALAADTNVHTPYLNGILDLSPAFMTNIYTAFNVQHIEPVNALTIPCWIIHVSSLVEFLVAMGFCWKWAEVSKNQRWKGLTWGLLPLHSSGITACVYHVFYNAVPILLPVQAILTCVGNTTAAYSAYRIASSNGWQPNFSIPVMSSSQRSTTTSSHSLSLSESNTNLHKLDDVDYDNDMILDDENHEETATKIKENIEQTTLVGFEDLGQALSSDNDYTFLIKLFVGCTIASYIIKYGEVFFDFPFDSKNAALTSLALIFIPSALNAFKWYKRSQDATFEGWF